MCRVSETEVRALSEQKTRAVHGWEGEKRNKASWSGSRFRCENMSASPVRKAWPARSVPSQQALATSQPTEEIGSAQSRCLFILHYLQVLSERPKTVFHKVFALNGLGP